MWKIILCIKNTHSRPAVAAETLVGEERALGVDNDTWVGLEILVTSWFWLVTDDWRLSAPWKEVPLLNVLTTSICNGGENEKVCLRWRCKINVPGSLQCSSMIQLAHYTQPKSWQFSIQMVNLKKWHSYQWSMSNINHHCNLLYFVMLHQTTGSLFRWF